MTTTQDAARAEILSSQHPRDGLIRADRLPHIWCPGCGLGIVLYAYVEAINKSSIPIQNQVIVSGIGCTARIAGYVNIDSYHTTHGRPVAFATGMKIAKPELEVTVISGDGDLFTIGGNHLIHAARRNLDLTILCVNNFNYGMTGGQVGATTPLSAKTTTTPYGNFEPSFNLPYLVAALGAPFVSRWTTIHVRQLTRAIRAAMQVDGFAFIEILSPCPPTFGKLNGFPEGLDQMDYFRSCSVVDDNADLSKIGLTMRPPDTIVVGDFVNVKKPSYLEVERRMLQGLKEVQK